MEKFLQKYWKQILATVIVITVLVLAYVFGRKSGSNNVTVVDDSGNVVQVSAADIQTATALAMKLKDDIYGWNAFGHDDAIYKELAQQSNTVFALVFTKYKELAGSGLIADINGEYYGTNMSQWGEWEVLSIIKNRATQLGLS